MKAHAYQLKIIEKKARPPIWRRALVPYGITFSVLAYILNEIMELEEPPVFRMVFEDKNVHLLEIDKLDRPADFSFFFTGVQGREDYFHRRIFRGRFRVYL